MHTDEEIERLAVETGRTEEDVRELLDKGFKVEPRYDPSSEPSLPPPRTPSAEEREFYAARESKEEEREALMKFGPHIYDVEKLEFNVEKGRYMEEDLPLPYALPSPQEKQADESESPHEILSQIAGQTAQFAVQIDRAMAERFNLITSANLMEQLEKHRVFEAKLNPTAATLGLSAADKKIILKNLSAPHTVMPTGFPTGSTLYFNVAEITKGLSPEGHMTALNNILNYQTPPSLRQRVEHGYQELLKIYRERTSPLFQAITPKEIAFYDTVASFEIIKDERKWLAHMKSSFFEQARLNPKLTNQLNSGSAVLVVISAAATAWNIAKSDNKVEAAVHEGTLLLSNIGGGWYGGMLGVAATSAICGAGAPMCALALVTGTSALGAAAGQYLGEVYWQATRSLGEAIREASRDSASVLHLANPTSRFASIFYQGLGTRLDCSLVDEAVRLHSRSRHDGSFQVKSEKTVHLDQLSCKVKTLEDAAVIGKCTVNTNMRATITQNSTTTNKAANNHGTSLATRGIDEEGTGFFAITPQESKELIQKIKEFFSSNKHSITEYIAEATSHGLNVLAEAMTYAHLSGAHLKGPLKYLGRASEIVSEILHDPSNNLMERLVCDTVIGLVKESVDVVIAVKVGTWTGIASSAATTPVGGVASLCVVSVGAYKFAQKITDPVGNMVQRQCHSMFSHLRHIQNPMAQASFTSVSHTSELLTCNIKRLSNGAVIGKCEINTNLTNTNQVRGRPDTSQNQNNTNSAKIFASTLLSSEKSNNPLAALTTKPASLDPGNLYLATLDKATEALALRPTLATVQTPSIPACRTNTNNSSNAANRSHTPNNQQFPSTVDPARTSSLLVSMGFFQPSGTQTPSMQSSALNPQTSCMDPGIERLMKCHERLGSSNHSAVLRDNSFTSSSSSHSPLMGNLEKLAESKQGFTDCLAKTRFDGANCTLPSVPTYDFDTASEALRYSTFCANYFTGNFRERPPPVNHSSFTGGWNHHGGNNGRKSHCDPRFENCSASGGGGVNCRDSGSTGTTCKSQF